MTHCVRCGASTVTRSRFCTSCGAQIPEPFADDGSSQESVDRLEVENIDAEAVKIDVPAAAGGVTKFDLMLPTSGDNEHRTSPFPIDQSAGLSAGRSGANRRRTWIIVGLVVLVCAGVGAGALFMRTRPSANDRFLDRVAVIANVDRKAVDIRAEGLLGRRDAVCGAGLEASARQADANRDSHIVTSAYQAAIEIECPSRRVQFDEALSAVSSERKTALTVQKAMDDYRAGRTALAKSEFQQLVKLNPSNKYAWYNLGVLAQYDGNTEGATAHYRKTIELDPKFQGALYNLGLMRYQAGDNDEAISLLRRAVVITPTDAQAHWNLGLALAARGGAGDNEQSVFELNKALVLDPSLQASLSPID